MYLPMYLLVIMEKSDQIWENNSFYKVKQKREVVTPMLACHLNIIIFYDQVYIQPTTQRRRSQKIEIDP